MPETGMASALRAELGAVRLVSSERGRKEFADTVGGAVGGGCDGVGKVAAELSWWEAKCIGADVGPDSDEAPADGDESGAAEVEMVLPKEFSADSGPVMFVPTVSVVRVERLEGVCVSIGGG